MCDIWWHKKYRFYFLRVFIQRIHYNNNNAQLLLIHGAQDKK